MILEVRIPISPRPAWLNRVKLIAASVRQWYPDTIITVSCYSQPPDEAVNGGYVNNWIIPSASDMRAWENTRAPYTPTIMSRFRGPFYGDNILMLDADVFPVKQFDDLLSPTSVRGVQAHVPPLTAAGWVSLFKSFGLSPPDMRYRYTGYGIMTAEHLIGPFYPNSGVICGPRYQFERLENPVAKAMRHFRAISSDVYWIDQIAFALAIAAADIPVLSRGIEFNFPNRASFDAYYADELRCVKLIHAMDTSVIDRDRDFCDTVSIDVLCARTDLNGSNEVLRAHVAAIREKAGV